MPVSWHVPSLPHVLPLPTARPRPFPPLQSFLPGASPAPCAHARAKAAVFRWQSGAGQAGLLDITSCGLTSGDPVVWVLSSPNPVGGPFACVG